MLGSVSFTGHRTVDEELATASLIDILKERRPPFAICGGAAGADTLAAEVCWKLWIPYSMALPHREYSRVYGLDKDPRWLKTVQRAYEVLFVVEGKPWHFGHNFKRNEWMVDHCELLTSISVFDPMGDIPTKGGTAHCVRYARKVKREIDWARCSCPLLS